MKFQSLAFCVAFAVATVSAAECTEKQLEAFNKIDQSPFKEACPSLFLGADSGANLRDIPSFTKESIAALEPCKAKKCLVEGKKQLDVTPDCAIDGFEVKATTAAAMKLCEAFNAGPVSVETAKSILKPITESMHKAFGIPVDGDGSTEDADAPTLGSDSKDKLANATVTETTTPIKPGAAQTWVPSPAPATKSDATRLSVVASVTFSTLAMSLTL